ncbi:MAG: DUF2330 domain-containing protein [Alphaproteobacteria bacterium]|nr:DUF2330 domain-containing protein [Alphaproteobacteria bacterium]
MHTLRGAPIALALVGLTASPAALACGGFFCDAAAPVEQAAERILFAIDDDTGTVEVQVQITYEGDAPEFAWILPVPKVPQLRTTVDDVFTRLSPPTRPTFNVSVEVEGTCKEGAGGGTRDLATADSDEAPRDDDGGVVVASQGTLGPYATAVLQADSVDSLVSWLTTHGYTVPASLEDKLATYLGDDSWFVALRLEKDRDVGDLRPIALTYEGTEASIPLRLTAVAATPDMRLQPYVFGKARAIPENYLHVVINPFAIDWRAGGANYTDVVSAAADEAGGKAFATDFAGPTSVYDGTFWSDGDYDLLGVRALGTANAAQVIRAMQNAGIPVSTGTVPFLRQVLPVDAAVLDRYGLTEVELYSQLDQYAETRSATVDGNALADRLEDPDDGWVPAMKHAQEIVDETGWVTRLTSSMDADEMDLDPLFVLNRDLQPVSNVHAARLVVQCGARLYTYDRAPLRLELEDGRSLQLPSDYLSDPAFDYTAWIGPLGNVAAERIEQGGRSGGLVTVTDNAAQIDALVGQLSAAVPTCGCDTRGAREGAVLGAFALLLGLRRRRR